MPTHAHGHGYSDLNFLIPELVSGVQFSKGPYLADQGDFATAGAANISYANALDRPHRARRAAAATASAARCSAASPAVGQRPPARRPSRVDAQRRSVDACPTTIGRSTASSATAQGDARQRLVDHRHGLSRRSGTRPTRFRRARRRRRASSAASARSIRPTAATPTATAARSSGSARRPHADQGHGVRHRLRPEPVLELHVLPRRPGARRSVRSRPIIASSPARRSAHRRLDALGRPTGAEHLRRAAPRTTTSRTSACITRKRVAARDCPRRTPCCRRSGGVLRAERDRAGRRGCERWPAFASTATASASTRRRPLQQRRRVAPASSARKAALVIGPFERHRAATRTPATASTATTRAARRSRAIRRPGAGRARDAARARQRRGSRRCALSRFRTCRRRCRCGRCSARVGAGVRWRRRHRPTGRPEPSMRASSSANYYSPRALG